MEVRHESPDPLDFQAFDKHYMAQEMFFVDDFNYVSRVAGPSYKQNWDQVQWQV